MIQWQELSFLGDIRCYWGLAAPSRTWGRGSRVQQGCHLNFLSFFFFFKDFIYFQWWRGKEKGKDTLMCERNIDWLPLACPNWGPGLQPRHVPWLGIKPATFWLEGWHSIHWVTSARALNFLRKEGYLGVYLELFKALFKCMYRWYATQYTYLMRTVCWALMYG